MRRQLKDFTQAEIVSICNGLMRMGATDDSRHAGRPLPVASRGFPHASVHLSRYNYQTPWCIHGCCVRDCLYGCCVCDDASVHLWTLNTPPLNCLIPSALTNAGGILWKQTALQARNATGALVFDDAQAFPETQVTLRRCPWPAPADQA